MAGLQCAPMPIRPQPSNQSDSHALRPHADRRVHALTGMWCPWFWSQTTRLQPEQHLPSTVLAGACGLVVMSLVKVGACWSATFGTGGWSVCVRKGRVKGCVNSHTEELWQSHLCWWCEVERRGEEIISTVDSDGVGMTHVMRCGCDCGAGVVVSRNSAGQWSAPCAVAAAGLGWGLQLGGELTDLVLVLRTPEAVSRGEGSRGRGGAQGVMVVAGVGQGGLMQSVAADWWAGR